MKQVFHPFSWQLIVHVTLQYSMHVRQNLTQYARVDSRVWQGKFERRKRQDHKICTECKLIWSSFVAVHCTGFDYMIHDLRTDIFQALFMKLPVIARSQPYCWRLCVSISKKKSVNTTLLFITKPITVFTVPYMFWSEVIRLQLCVVVLL
jgi:hypothetical protein